MHYTNLDQYNSFCAKITVQYINYNCTYKIFLWLVKDALQFIRKEKLGSNKTDYYKNKTIFFVRLI